MNIIKNSKQMDFLMSIKNIGMMMIFRKKIAYIDIMDAFAPFVEYIEDEDIALKYADSVLKIVSKIDLYSPDTLLTELSPDDLLIELGQYTPYIIYNDEDNNKTVENPLYDDDEGWFWK